MKIDTNETFCWFAKSNKVRFLDTFSIKKFPVSRLGGRSPFFSAQPFLIRYRVLKK